MTEMIIFGMIALLGYLTYLSFNLSEEHKVFKTILLIMSLLCAFAVTGYVATSNQYCEITIDNITHVPNPPSNISHYEYQLTCFDTTSSMPQTIYKIMTWIVILFFTYVIVYLMLQAIKYLQKSVPK